MRSLISLAGEDTDGNARAEQLAQVAVGMKRRDIAILDRQHPLVAILSKVVDPKESVDLEAGRKLAANLLESAILNHGSAEREMYPSLLVRTSVLFTLPYPASDNFPHLPAVSKFL